MPREDGLETNAAGENGKWYCEDEPVPSIMDTWGRGAIPMKKKIKVDISVRSIYHNVMACPLHAPLSLSSSLSLSLAVSVPVPSYSMLIIAGISVD
jgi:hypothetical protein